MKKKISKEDRITHHTVSNIVDMFYVLQVQVASVVPNEKTGAQGHKLDSRLLFIVFPCCAFE